MLSQASFDELVVISRCRRSRSGPNMGWQASRKRKELMKSLKMLSGLGERSNDGVVANEDSDVQESRICLNILWSPTQICGLSLGS